MGEEHRALTYFNETALILNFILCTKQMCSQDMFLFFIWMNGLGLKFRFYMYHIMFLSSLGRKKCPKKVFPPKSAKNTFLYMFFLISLFNDRQPVHGSVSASNSFVLNNMCLSIVFIYQRWSLRIERVIRPFGNGHYRARQCWRPFLVHTPNHNFE